MNIIICKDQKESVEKAHQWLLDRLAKDGTTRVFIPAGETPRPLFSYWRSQLPTVLERCAFIQIDEVVSGRGKGQFADFLRENLTPWSAQIEFIDDAAGGADLGILGLGLNGHVAFHEPGLPGSMEASCVRLSPETCKRLNLEPGSWGVTYGVGAFNKCKSLLLMVFGESKADVLRRLMNRDPELPATLLLGHQDLTILADKKAYGDRP